MQFSQEVHNTRSGLTSSVLPLITSDQDLIGPGSLYAGILAIAIPGRVLFSQVKFGQCDILKNVY